MPDSSRLSARVAVRVGASQLAEIIALADGSAGIETCGLLFGGEEEITSFQPARNVAVDAARAFEIDPASLFVALRAERVGGPRVIGHYHSHPNGSAVPSPRDLAAAGPDMLWLILGAGEARLWRPGKEGFDEVALAIG